MDTWSPEVLFISHYVLAGLTALSLLVKRGDGISLKMVGYAGFYSLLGGTFSPVLAEITVATLAKTFAVVGTLKIKLSLMYSAGIGGGLIALPQLLEFNKRLLKLLVSSYDEPDKKP